MLTPSLRAGAMRRGALCCSRSKRCHIIGRHYVTERSLGLASRIFSSKPDDDGGNASLPSEESPLAGEAEHPPEDKESIAPASSASRTGWDQSVDEETEQWGPAVQAAASTEPEPPSATPQPASNTSVIQEPSKQGAYLLSALILSITFALWYLSRMFGVHNDPKPPVQPKVDEAPASVLGRQHLNRNPSLRKDRSSTSSATAEAPSAPHPAPARRSAEERHDATKQARLQQEKAAAAATAAAAAATAAEEAAAVAAPLLVEPAVAKKQQEEKQEAPSKAGAGAAEAQGSSPPGLPLFGSAHRASPSQEQQGPASTVGPGGPLPLRPGVRPTTSGTAEGANTASTHSGSRTASGGLAGAGDPAQAPPAAAAPPLWQPLFWQQQADTPGASPPASPSPAASSPPAPASLPKGSSPQALTERAQMALKAAAAASDASQRAAVHSAAASTAASRAADAAERAAVAATQAQAALETSTEDAINAAEGRAKQAAVIAKEAEGRAARSATSAAAYEERAQAQAAIASEAAKAVSSQSQSKDGQEKVPGPAGQQEAWSLEGAWRALMGGGHGGRSHEDHATLQHAAESLGAGGAPAPAPARTAGPAPGTSSGGGAPAQQSPSSVGEKVQDSSGPRADQKQEQHQASSTATSPNAGSPLPDIGAAAKGLWHRLAGGEPPIEGP